MFVTLQPNTNTNPSGKYRVVDSEDWARYVNGATNTVAFAGQFDDFDDAQELRDRLNNIPHPESMDYLKGYNQAFAEPLENILLYAHADTDFQRGWNAAIKERKPAV